MAPGDTRIPGGTVLPGPGPSTDSARPPLGTGRIETADLGAFTLEEGATLPLTIAYRHDGPGPDAPQVLVIHALTGSADAAGDWWAPLIGPGAGLRHDAGRRPVHEPPRRPVRVHRAHLDQPRDRRALGRRLPPADRARRGPGHLARSPTPSASSGSRSWRAGPWAA